MAAAAAKPAVAAGPSPEELAAAAAAAGAAAATAASVPTTAVGGYMRAAGQLKLREEADSFSLEIGTVARGQLVKVEEVRGWVGTILLLDRSFPPLHLFFVLGPKPLRSAPHRSGRTCKTSRYQGSGSASSTAARAAAGC